MDHTTTKDRHRVLRLLRLVRQNRISDYKLQRLLNNPRLLELLLQCPKPKKVDENELRRVLHLPPKPEVLQLGLTPLGEQWGSLSAPEYYASIDDKVIQMFSDTLIRGAKNLIAVRFPESSQGTTLKLLRKVTRLEGWNPATFQDFLSAIVHHGPVLRRHCEIMSTLGSIVRTDNLCYSPYIIHTNRSRRLKLAVNPIHDMRFNPACWLLFAKR